MDRRSFLVGSSGKSLKDKQVLLRKTKTPTQGSRSRPPVGRHRAVQTLVRKESRRPVASLPSSRVILG